MVQRCSRVGWRSKPPLVGFVLPVIYVPRLRHCPRPANPLVRPNASVVGIELHEPVLVAVFDDAGELQHLIVQHGVDAGGQHLHGDECFGEVLHGVSIAQLVRTQGAGEDDRDAWMSNQLVAGLAGDGQTVSAVHNDHAVVRFRHALGHARDELVVLGGHLEAVLVHERHANDADALQLQAGEHDVEHADAVGQNPRELIVRLLDGAAGRDEDDALLCHNSNAAGR